MLAERTTHMKDDRARDFQQDKTLLERYLQPVELLNELVKLAGCFPHVHQRQVIHPGLQTLWLITAQGQVLEVLLGKSQPYFLGLLIHASSASASCRGILFPALLGNARDSSDKLLIYLTLCDISQL